ncbi:TPA: putative phage abortive infection protein [Pseudomonas aeruginosa]|nr:putative phage abortive infection protein [Pseudomonas aeruginosa]HBO4698734.1 putative phage abortive infection protein [Pseudomonas aeruginosa]HCF4415424.1 putative phage abortive infection protein [Pseudomonas aeruginosa]
MKNGVGSGWLIFGIIFLIVCVYAGYYIFLYVGYEFAASDGSLAGVRSGTFGDAFGALNALFSGLAFSGVLITIILQRKDIREGQQEFARQKIEDQFYSLLRFQQDVVSKFDLQKTITNERGGGRQLVTVGRDCFKAWVKMLREMYVDSEEVDTSQRIKASYRDLWRKHQGDLGLYYRSLYSVFRYVSESDYTEKKKLANVARSLLSDFELVILFYNCVASSGGERFKAYACEFALFDNLDVGLLLNMDDVVMLDKEAFGDNQEALSAF